MSILLHVVSERVGSDITSSTMVLLMESHNSSPPPIAMLPVPLYIMPPWIRDVNLKESAH